MKLSQAMEYLYGFIQTNKLYLFISLSLSGVIQVITRLLGNHFSTEAAQLPVVSITIFTFIAFVLITLIGVINTLLNKNSDGTYKIKENIADTVGKAFGLLIYYTIALSLISVLYDNFFALTVIFGPIILTILKEYTELGNLIEKQTGKKSYLFSVIDRLFILLEFRYFKNIEEKSVEEVQEDNINQQEEEQP